MSLIKWDQTGEKKFESGVDHCVLYQIGDGGVYAKGKAWNGITTITESPAGAEANKTYADNIVYANLVSAETFGGTIEALTYPVEFEQNDGTAAPKPGLALGQQARTTFGLSYRTKVGDDIKGQDAGYKLHLVWGALAAPSEKAYATINDSPETIAFSWEFSTTPVQVEGFAPSASMTIDSTQVDPSDLQDLEDLLYGKEAVLTGTPTPEVAAVLPLPDDVIAIFSGTSNLSARVFDVTTDPDGTATLTGNDVVDNQDGTNTVGDDTEDDSSSFQSNPDGTTDVTVNK